MGNGVVDCFASLIENGITKGEERESPNVKYCVRRRE